MLIPTDYHNLQSFHGHRVIHPGMTVWVCNGKTAQKPPHKMILGNCPSWPPRDNKGNLMWSDPSISCGWYLYNPQPDKHGRHARETFQPHTLMALTEKELWQPYHEQLQEQIRSLFRKASTIYNQLTQLEDDLQKKGVHYAHTEFMAFLPADCDNAAAGTD